MTKETAQTALRFIRNFAIFFALLLTCAGGLGYIVVQGEKDLQQSNSWIFHTHKIIVAAEELSTMLERLLSAQRGYLLTRDADFLDNYNQTKIAASQNLEKIQALTRDNAAQSMRVDALRIRFEAYTKLLENRVAMLARTTSPGEVVRLVGTSQVREAREDVLRMNGHILREEHELMARRLAAMHDTKQNYFTSLVLGGSVSLVLLLVLNSFLLHAQAKRTEAEGHLAIMQERLNLAVRGSRDGIFDWDLATNELYWSDEYKAMLGYKPDELETTIEKFKQIVHPNDSEDLWDAYNLYINGSTSEFDSVFRMQHRSGRWIWVNARGKAVFDENGKPVRFLGAHSDITHMKEAEQRLTEEKQKAEKANRAKTEFLAHMSHEIRTPLTAISGIAEILQRQIASLSDRQQQLIKTLHSSSASLKDLINDILDFSKIESGEIELKEEEINLNDMFAQIISMMSVPAHQKGLEFDFTYDAVEDDIIFCDPLRLRQIVVNLISNAIKFTEHGSVQINATKYESGDDLCLRIDVRDTGIGIEPENFDIVFERFKQVDTSVSRKHGGTGLGLAISQKLAQRMGGEIVLESSPGLGSTFTFIMPMKMISFANTAMQKEKSSQKLANQLKAKLEGNDKVLLVEDYDGNIVVMSYILEELNCNYELAKTGREAVDLWERNHYDLILMDIQMPEMDGFAATQRIRELEQERQQQRTPIIGMTAHALVGDKDKCIAAGMDAYLPKPIVEEDLKREILKYLSQKKAA